MVSMRGRAAATFAAVLAFGAIATPARADAASATNQLNLTGGSLTIGTLTATTLPATAVSAGTVSGAIDSGNWSDTTGSGAGWNGTIQTTGWTLQGPWQVGSGATGLSSTASGSYSGTAGAAEVVVTISSGGTALNTPFSYVDYEGSTKNTGNVTTCTNGSACTVSNGVTITFNLATTYTAGGTYTAYVGVSTSQWSMTLATGSATGPTAVSPTNGGSNLPVLMNNGSLVTSSATKFVHATAGTGMGTFTLAPGVTVNWDANNTWSSTVAGANYTATATYTISSGP